jgi:hypothetical protein
MTDHHDIEKPDAITIKSLALSEMPEVLTIAVTSSLVGIWSAALVLLFLR